MRFFITGTAGFIGFHLARLLLDEGHEVAGFDGLTDYYDVRLKQHRHEILRGYGRFTAVEAMLEDKAAVERAMHAARPQVVIHLAAQAGVRYSLENPDAYVGANLVGTFHVIDAARRLPEPVQHLLLASTSSVYGGNTEMPFREQDKADLPLTLYAATKKANEAMSHAYAHLYGLPTTAFRFFTVYGPWGRPDMALFKFTKGILNGEPIDIYNRGEMFRDFTYVQDLVRAIRLLVDVPPPRVDARGQAARVPADTLSPVAPWRVVNIGNSSCVRLMDYVEALEHATGRQAVLNLLPMQTGDVPATAADCTLLHELTGFRPETPIADGVARFVEWYRGYHEP